MAEDMTNIALSAHASEVANRMKESGYFEDALKNLIKYMMQTEIITMLVPLIRIIMFPSY